jgi:hypothetical protein
MVNLPIHKNPVLPIKFCTTLEKGFVCREERDCIKAYASF